MHLSAINSSSNNGVPFWYAANNNTAVAVSSSVEINPDKDEMKANLDAMHKILKEIDAAYKACKDDKAREEFRASLTDMNNKNGFCRRLNEAATNLHLSNEKLETNFWISPKQHDINEANIRFIRALTTKPEAGKDTDALFNDKLDVAVRALVSMLIDLSDIK